MTRVESDSRPGPDTVWIPGGTFLMGSDQHYPEEAPARPVTVDGFWIDRHAVTNREFDRFIRKTGAAATARGTPRAPATRRDDVDAERPVGTEPHGG